MYHLRQIFTTIGVVSTMYVAGSYSADVIFGFLRFETDVAILVHRIVAFVLAMLAGALLMRLLTWKWRLPAALILPALMPFVVAMPPYLGAPEYGVEMGFLEAVWLSRFLFVYIAGMLVGALLARYVFRPRDN